MIKSGDFRNASQRDSSRTLDIAVLIKTDSDWHRNVIQGLAKFSEDTSSYRLIIPKADQYGEVLLPDRWQGDGVVCRLTSPRQCEKILSRNLPCVNTSWLATNNQIPKVVSDDAGCANASASYFLDRQYENLAYVGVPPWANYSNTILQTLSRRCGERKVQFHNFEGWSTNPEDQGIHHPDLQDWLKRLPKPTAVVVWSSFVGYHVSTACAAAHIDMPRQIAILCIEHDPFWSALSSIPLSYIDQDPERVGYQSGKVLRSLIGGAKRPEAPVLVRPIGVVQRHSTDVSAIKDPVLRIALSFINENAKTGMTVKELVSVVGISRRALEAKFNTQLKCSPAVYIRKIQLQSVAKQLRGTNLSITDIAAQTGFAYPEVLMRSFKREFGVTPMQFRGAGRLK